MGSQATYDDANLVLRLYELRREETLRKARTWYTKYFYAASEAEYLALCPPGSQEDAYFRMVTSYWEMAGSIVSAGVLNVDLLLASTGEPLFVWERVRDLIPTLRARIPNFLIHLERLAQAKIDDWNKVDPATYPAFQQRVRALLKKTDAQNA